MRPKIPNQPIPNRKIFLSAEWRYLAMLNFEVDPSIVEPFVPRGTELDFHHGRTYVSIVGFLFLKSKLLGLPIPFHRNFEELNLRFYVRRHEESEVRRGVVFIKELVPLWAVAKVARWAYNENYETVKMGHSIEGLPLADVTTKPCLPNAKVAYQWEIGERWNELCIDVKGTAEPLREDSHQQFIAEHYWGYSRQRDGGTMEYQVEHPSWNVWHDCQARFDCDVERLYPPEFLKVLTSPPASAFVADGSAIAVYKPRRIA